MNKYFLTLGKQPLANNFQSKYSPYFYNLKLKFNLKTKIVSINKKIDKEIMFSKDYPYRSSRSSLVSSLFRKLAKDLKKNYQFKRILEIGSNDGTFAQNFNKNKIVCIEPCKNVGLELKKKGYNVVINYFDKNLIEKLKKNFGKFDLIFSANTITHINNLRSVINNIKKILSENGTFILEEPSFLSCYKNNAFDQFYNEHIYVLSAIALTKYLKMNKMEIYKIENINVHGGSLRYFIKQKSNNLYKIDQSVKKQIKKEKKYKLDKFSTYINFGKKIEKLKKKLIEIFDKIKSNNGKIIGYGASAKAVTVINYCNLKENYFEYFVDNTKDKINKLLPGTKIKVKKYKIMNGKKNLYYFLGAWNFKLEIFKKEKNFLKKKGKFITHLPHPRIIR